MPTSSESLTASKPFRIFFYKTPKNPAPSRTIEVVRTNRSDSFRSQPSRSVTPRNIYTSPDDLEEIPTKDRWKRYLWLALLMLILLLAIAIFAMLIAALVLLTRSTTTTTTTTTTSTTTKTTTPKCVSPFVQASSGKCINILIDINNCGKLNNVCPSSYTSCSAGLCSNLASIILLNGTYLWTASVNGSIDDAYYSITLPFNITFYNTTIKSLTVTTNGVICFGVCATTFTETNLPTSAFSGITVLPFWDDLYIFANTSQGIYYDTQSTAPNRIFVIEYYCSHYLQPTDYYHFQVVFYENMPNIVKFIYYEATDGGASSTIGVQSSSGSSFIQYSFDQANSVTQNMVLTFNTNTGTYSTSSIG